MHGNSKRDNELWTNCFKICERSPHPLSVNSRHWTLDRTEGLQFKVEMKLWTLERHLLSAKVSWIDAFGQHMVENLARAHHQYTTFPVVHISTQEIYTHTPWVYIAAKEIYTPHPRGASFSQEIHTTPPQECIFLHKNYPPIPLPHSHLFFASLHWGCQECQQWKCLSGPGRCFE